MLMMPPAGGVEEKVRAADAHDAGRLAGLGKKARAAHSHDAVCFSFAVHQHCWLLPAELIN